MAELAARQQRRTISSYCEWAIEQSLKNVDIAENTSVVDEADVLWDPNEPVRLVRLAMRYPHLLTHEEQVLYRLINKNTDYWSIERRVCQVGEEPDGTPITKRMPVVTFSEKSVNEARLTADWPKLLAVARGEATEDSLPKPAEITEPYVIRASRSRTVRFKRS